MLYLYICIAKLSHLSSLKTQITPTFSVSFEKLWCQGRAKLYYYVGDIFGLVYKLWSSQSLSRYQGEQIDLFFNRFRQLSTQLHRGYSSSPGHIPQDICLCYSPPLRRLMRLSDTHSSQIWRGSASTGMTLVFFYFIVGTCFVKYLIIFRLAISGTMTQSSSFVQYQYSICFSFRFQSWLLLLKKSVFLIMKEMVSLPSAKGLPENCLLNEDRECLSNLQQWKK